MNDESLEAPRIRDIPSISGPIKEMESLLAVRPALRFLKPFLRLLGVDTKAIGGTLGEAQKLRGEAEVLAMVPDRFNDLFGPLGWIIHGDMNIEVTREAIGFAEDGAMSEAEDLLVAYYSADEAASMLRRMQAINAFTPRMRLAELALEDYRERRFHASIPVVLALMDGLVSELHERRRGFFAAERDLTAWDSIAAHERGLNALADVFQKGRRSLNTNEITLPYRHGILHGWEMAYDTPLVAAKTWAALFSLRDWAIKAERGGQEAAPPEATPTWGELFRQIADNEAVKKRIAVWTPRKLSPGVDFPPHADPDAYPVASPERALVEFLQLWKARNYGHMSKHLRVPFVTDGEITPGRVRETYDSWILQDFTIRSVTDEAPSLSEVEVDLRLEGLDELRTHTFRLLYWKPHGGAAVRGDSGGQWGIVNWYM